jgi:phosphoadenosine phosphosulfate reductase
MALITHGLFDTIDLVAMSLARIKEFEPPEGYYLAFSGGKDSCVIKHLADRAGVKYDAHYNAIGIDPPELTRFIHRHHPDVKFEITRPSIFRMMIKKQIPPTRIARWCCAAYKEKGGHDRTVMLGVRWAESVNRKKKRRLYEVCYKDKQQRILNPIIDWGNDDVWEYIKGNNIPYCKLYDEGFKRLGCVMCPMGGSAGMKKGAERYPKIAQRWKRAFDEMPGYTYEWWIENKKKENEDQECFNFDN